MTTGKFVRCLAQTNELNEIELKTHKITKTDSRYAIQAGIMKAGYSSPAQKRTDSQAGHLFIQDMPSQWQLSYQQVISSNPSIASVIPSFLRRDGIGAVTQKQGLC